MNGGRKRADEDIPEEKNYYLDQFQLENPQ